MLFPLLCALVLASAQPAGDLDYLFYLHGQIVEGSDGRPSHPDYGVYDHPAIVAAFEEAGFTVLGEIRPADTDGQAYAARVVTQVDSLIELGVSPDRISVVGMSKGGGIALAACAALERDDVNFVFLATCVNWIQEMPVLRLRGRILSIFEASDRIAGSCAVALESSEVGPPFRELQTNTGRGHGAFYRPDDAWLLPVTSWCRGAENPRTGRVEAMYQDYRSEFAEVPDVDPETLARWMQDGEAVLVDVRRGGEREVSAIPGAVTREEFESGDFTGRRIVTYCTIGYRSGKYAEKLRSRGLDAYNLEAGILGWVHDFMPVEHEGTEVREVHVYGRQWNLLPSWYRAVW